MQLSMPPGFATKRAVRCDDVASACSIRSWVLLLHPLVAPICQAIFPDANLSISPGRSELNLRPLTDDVRSGEHQHDGNDDPKHHINFKDGNAARTSG